MCWAYCESGALCSTVVLLSIYKFVTVLDTSKVIFIGN